MKTIKDLKAFITAFVNEKEKYIIQNDRVKLFRPNHHRAGKTGYVYRSILVMEKELGRDIRLPEIVHHIDENPLNDVPDNLKVFANNGLHLKHHAIKNPLYKALSNYSHIKFTGGKSYPFKTFKRKTIGYKD